MKLLIKENNDAFWESLHFLIKSSEIIIDRPKGSLHPKYGFAYPVDYGYLKNTSSMDGDGIDVWIGSEKSAAAASIAVTIDLNKRDSEIKIFIGCSDEEKAQIYKLLNENSMKCLFIHNKQT